MAVTIGRDGFSLLEAIYGGGTPEEVKELGVVEVLRQVWVQRYYRLDGEVYWRTKKKWGQPAAGGLISSVQDVDARYSVKGTKEWTGYKVHLTETCAASHPRLITQVETTAGTVHDVKVTRSVQDDLTSRGLAPEVHLVDMGYVEADLLLSSQERGIDLVGPMLAARVGRTGMRRLLISVPSTSTGNPGGVVSWGETEPACFGSEDVAGHTEHGVLVPA